MNIIEKALKKIKEKNLVEKNDRIVLGCSGGPDSIFLLEVFLKIKEEYNLTLALAHINHLYRGAEADRDENFVRDLGEKNGIQVFVKRKSMELMAKEEKITLEEAGREIRYSFFDEVLEKINGNKVALAHNLDDQIETFLFRLIRGSSLEGLEGINDRRDKYIRPINEIYKSEIIDYLDTNNIPYVVDSTNLENDYTRNSIRLNLIPFIEKRYNPKFKEKINSLLNEIREVNEILEVDYSKYIFENTLLVQELINEKSFYIKGKIINYYLNKNGVSVLRRKIENIINILSSGGSKKIKLDKSCTLIKEYDKIFVENGKIAEKEVKEIKMTVPGEAEFGSYIISAFRETKKRDNDSSEFTTNLKEGDELLIRGRVQGDVMIPIGMDNYKKLKEIMINSKVPKDERGKIPVILLDNEIVWAAGVKKSKKFISEKESENIVLRLRRK